MRRALLRSMHGHTKLDELCCCLDCMSTDWLAGARRVANMLADDVPDTLALMLSSEYIIDTLMAADVGISDALDVSGYREINP